MCASPLPSGSELLVSKSNLVYFRDTVHDIFTIEHPLTQRFLKVLERQRVDLIAQRAKPSVSDLTCNQPEMEFLKRFNHLQLPCSDCGMCQSTVVCNQCIASYCDTCFGLLHACGSRTTHETRKTAAGSKCSACDLKQPQVFCGDCSEYFCFECFEPIHRRGKRIEHRAMRVDATDGNILSSRGLKCDECKDVNACLYCDVCMDSFCLVCFWFCHLNGNRRRHPAILVTARPLCCQCETTRASIFCEQCQELLCTDCFATMHEKGGRKLHLFMDAMNVLLLLERLDPSFQDFIANERRRVMHAVTYMQAHVRGHQHRRRFKRKRELATLIQSRWRGGEARKKLMGVLDQFNWRKRQVTSSLTYSGELAADKQLQALDSRTKVAAAQQHRIASKLRMDFDLQPIDPLMATDGQPVADRRGQESPTALLKSRINTNIKESQKLRRLLNIDKE